VVSTVHSIHLPTDVVETLRRRPRVTSSNARNVKPIFGDSWRLKLFIPLAIHLYNHYMNGADLANQRRSHLTTQRKHNVRTWRPLFYWLLDVTLTNCFILWRLQARRGGTNIDWDPVEFNRALGSALLVYSSAQESIASSPAKAPLKTIAPNRYKGVLPGIPMKVEEVTDLRSLLVARSHDMRTETFRRECIGCKIDGKASRGARQVDASLANVEFAKKVNTRCLQCNVYLCRKGKCWERFHNSRKGF
jgi:hypothetical protein